MPSPRHSSAGGTPASVDNSVRLDGGDHHACQALAHYVARAPLSLQSLTYDSTGGKILYHTTYNPYFKQNTSLWHAMDFIAALTQFIPPWGVRYITTTGCTPPDARHGGSRCFMSRVLLPGW